MTQLAFARVTDPATSKAAAAKQRGGAEAAITRLLSEHPERDFTADEIAEAAHKHQPTIVSALSRLKRAGRVVVVGTRRSARGCEASAYRWQT